MMLRIPEPPQAQGEGPKDFAQSAEEMLEGAEIVPLKFEGGEVPTTKEIMDRLQDVLRARNPEGGGGGKSGAVLDMQPEVSSAPPPSPSSLVRSPWVLDVVQFTGAHVFTSP